MQIRECVSDNRQVKHQQAAVSNQDWQSAWQQILRATEEEEEYKSSVKLIKYKCLELHILESCILYKCKGLSFHRSLILYIVWFSVMKNVLYNLKR